MDSTSNKPSHTKSVAKMVVVVIAMFGFGYALVPLYDVFCDVFDLNGKPSNEVAEAPPEVDSTREVKVQFVTTLNSSLAWDFEPEVPMVSLHPGEMKTVMFKVHNRSGRDMVGQAVPSVAPSRAADHFKKTECFCFTQQKLAADEVKDMPVRFYLDPALPGNVHEVTLSYTFFDSGVRAEVSQ